MKVKCFGIAKEIIKSEVLKIDNSEAISSVALLRKYILDHYPALQQYKSFMIAVNDNYASDDLLVSNDDEIAIIPPVSGG